MLNRIPRALKIEFNHQKAILVMGPRKTGKSTYLKDRFPKAEVLDFLKSEVRLEYELHPEKLRQWVLKNHPPLVIVDEIQKVPSLLDEIHWCLENTNTRFILCGSSARKLKNVASGILGGRAMRYDFFPLTIHEISRLRDPEKSESILETVFNNGLIPDHFLLPRPDRVLRTYLLDYLEEEIRQEAKVSNLPSFSRFLETAALMNGELLNFTKVASEAGVSAPTIKSYYKIIEDTLLGFTLSPWEKSQTRRLIQTQKFYLFDCGVLRALREFRRVELKSMEAGKFFETLLLNEIRAYLSYNEKFEPLFFWRTSTDLELDLVVGRTPKLVAEFKCTETLRTKDFQALRAFCEDYPKTPHRLVIYCGQKSLKTEDGIQVLPWQSFCQLLWKHKFL